MAAEQLANPVETTIAGTGLAAGTTTTMTVASSANFPAVTTGAGTFFRAVITDAEDTIYEYIKVTNISGTTWTIERATEDSTRFPASARAVGLRVVLVATAQSFLKTIRLPHTFSIGGEIKVPSGQTDYIPGFFVPVPVGQTAKIVSARYRIAGGTSATLSVWINGSTVTGLTGLVAGTSAATTAASGANTLADGDIVLITVTAVSGTPTNLSFTLYVDYAV